MKDRISLTLDSKIVKEIDSMVDGIIIRSRSNAIEKVLKDHLVERKTVVILAGGNPDKIFVKELDCYRPLAKIGKVRLIEDIISKCRSAGFNNILIIGFPIVISRLYETLGNGEKYNVTILYIEENKELGTAKTLEHAKKYLKTDFLFLPCDHWFDFDLKSLYDFHLSNSGTATLAVHTRTSFDWKTSIVEMNGYRIIDYEEFPKKPKTHLVSILTGFMKPEIFDFIPPGDVYWSLQEHIFPKLAGAGKLIGYPIAGKWVNVHSINDIRKVNDILKL